MKLHKLTAWNFMPYKGELVIDFPPDETRNVMIVFGENMRGKTSILNALRWGFYGKVIGRHSRIIPLHEVVNRDATLVDDWKLQVFIQFEANGRKYDLRRSANRKGHVGIPQRPEDFSISVQLSIDGVPISGDQVEAEIDQIAPEQTSRFFLFDGELLQEYETLLFEGSDQGRKIKEAIEHVLGVPALINGRDELGALLRAATKQQTRDLSHIHGLEKQAERQQDLTVRQDAHERDLANLQTRLGETRKEREKLDDELESAASILTAKGKLDGFKSQKDMLEALLKQREEDRRGILSGTWLDILDARLQVKRDVLQRRQRELEDGLRKQGEIQARVAALQKLLSSSVCPTCGQSMESHRQSATGHALGALQAEAEAIRVDQGELQSVSGQLSSLAKVRTTNSRERLADVDRDRKKAQVDLQRAENEIERLNDEIAGYDTADLARKRVLQQEKLKEEGRLQESIKRVEGLIQQVKVELAVAQKAIEGLAAARTQKSTLKVSVIADLEKVFSESIEHLRDRLRSQVESLATSAFKSMTTQKAYRGLEINANYGLSIIDDTGRKVPLRSSGAEQIVALSLIDGLNRTGRAIGPIVMDTPFGRLDLTHRDNILTYLPTVTSQFVMLVHSGEIRPETDLVALKPRIGAVYRIEEVSATISKIERASL